MARAKFTLDTPTIPSDGFDNTMERFPAEQKKRREDGRGYYKWPCITSSPKLQRCNSNLPGSTRRCVLLDAKLRPVFFSE